MKATEQYFPVVLFVVLYKVVLTFESVDEILKCNQCRLPRFPQCRIVYTFHVSPEKGLVN